MICPCNRSFGSGRVLSHPAEKVVLQSWQDGKEGLFPSAFLPQNTLFQSRFALKSMCSWACRTAPRLIEVHPQPHPEGLSQLPSEVTVLLAVPQLLHLLLLVQGHAGDLQGVEPGRCPAPHGVQVAGAVPHADLEGSVLVALGDDVAHAAPEGRQQLQDVLPAAQPGHVHSHLQGTLCVKASPAHLF